VMRRYRAASSSVSSSAVGLSSTGSASMLTPPLIWDLKAFDEDEKRASGRGGGSEIIYRLRWRVGRRRKRPRTAVTSTSGLAGFGTCTASSSSLLYPLWST
jgi:hypothetical protein